MKQSTGLLIAMAAVVIVAGIVVLDVLDTGWKTVATKGEIGPFVVGDSKLETIAALTRTKEASAIIVNNETLLLETLASQISQDDPSTLELRKALDSNVWRFSPNIGHLGSGPINLLEAAVAA
jgi:hypothetical protein